MTDGRGVLLMTYGSPASLDRDDVADYLARVRSGRPPAPELVDEFVRRYRAIGGSPLVERTRALANALADRLGWPVVAGMRFSDPSIEEGLAMLRDRGASEVAAIVLSPQYSPLLMGGYSRTVEAALDALDAGAPHEQLRVTVAGAWHDEPAFVGALAGRVREAVERHGSGDRPIVLMTAHSLPREVALREPDYVEQLRATARAVAARAGLGDDDWRFCWQSAGHEPGEWMTPDFADLLPALAEEGCRSVIVAPVQFLSDHLETLYDVDIAARAQADASGLRFERVRSLDADPGLVAALAEVARRTVAGARVGSTRPDQGNGVSAGS